MLFINNVWIFFILVTVLNAFSLKVSSKKYVDKQPDLRKGYDQIFKGYLIYFNIPWIIMGIIILFGGVPSIFSFLRPRDGNIFVLSFWAILVILLILSIWWFYFNDGAEFLVKYPGLFNVDTIPLMALKMVFGGALVIGIMGIGSILMRIW